MFWRVLDEGGHTNLDGDELVEVGSYVGDTWCRDAMMRRRREGMREGGRERGKDGGREGGRERGKDGGREGGRE